MGPCWVPSQVAGRSPCASPPTTCLLLQIIFEITTRIWPMEGTVALDDIEYSTTGGCDSSPDTQGKGVRQPQTTVSCVLWDCGLHKPPEHRGHRQLAHSCFQPQRRRFDPPHSSWAGCWYETALCGREGSLWPQVLPAAGAGCRLPLAQCNGGM